MNSILLAVIAALPFWQDIQMTSVNADTRRTEVVYFPSREKALSKGFRESENYLSLNGVWDFKYFEDHHDIAQPDSWDSIMVPGNWEVQGHGVAIYVNIPYEFCPPPATPVPGVLPEEFPGALYHRTFTVPSEWEGREVYLNLCGTKSGTYVYVNGQEIGYNEDSKDLARYRITDAVKPGENDLMLKIYRFSQGSFLECQDFWRISGIERDVYLSSEKTDSGFDFNVISTLKEDLTTGVFQLRMTSKAPTEVFYELIDPSGEVVSDSVFEFSGKAATIADEIPSVKTWSAETPNLYTLVLRVNGEYTRFHVGFRRLEIKPVKDGDREVSVFLVNGRPVKFKGVNMHEHNPYTGHYVTRENILEDLLLMKKANINAIRTCHYPQQREFYELCDSLGFYVYDEANIESHGMGYRLDRTLGNNPEWYAKHLDRVLNMYRRTANYPCVTFLSLGNEAGNGVNFYGVYKELKALEENGMNRPVVYERAEYEWNTDMIVPQYPDAAWFKRMGETYTKRPVCPNEYAHAMGNSTGSLDWQWENIYSYTQLQGGFIWDWVDQGLYDRERVWTYGGDYGKNAPSDANFLCNGIVNPDREPHPAFYEVKHIYQNITIGLKDVEKGIFEVGNRFYFTTLDGLKVKWWVERDGKKIRQIFRNHVLRFKTAPQGTEEFMVKLPSMKKDGQYRIFFETYDGMDIIACDEILLKDSFVPKAFGAKGSLEFTDGETEVVVRGKGVELVFDKAEGYVKSWKTGGKDMVNPDFGIRPNYWRAATDNDYGNNAQIRLAQYRTVPAPSSVSTSLTDDGCVLISLKGSGVRADERYLVFPDGTLQISVTTAPEAKGIEIPRLGFRMRVPSDKFSYFGRGPVENYWDRASCTFKSRFSSSASAEYFPYVRPQETGHHTDTDWLRIGGLTVRRSGEPFEFNALRMSVEDLDGGPAKAQTHISDVPSRDYTELCIDYRMTGVGGYDSWGARPEKERSLWSDRSYTYSFVLTHE